MRPLEETGISTSSDTERPAPKESTVDRRGRGEPERHACRAPAFDGDNAWTTASTAATPLRGTPPWPPTVTLTAWPPARPALKTRVGTRVWKAPADCAKPITYHPATSTLTRTDRDAVFTSVARPPLSRRTASDDTDRPAANRTTGRF